MERDDRAAEAGRKAALADVAAGRLAYRWTGHAGHHGHWIVTQLAKRFGVGVDRFGVCFVTASSVSFNDGYNSVLAAEIDRRYGAGAFGAVHQEAKTQSDADLWDVKQAWLSRNNQPDSGLPG